MTILSDQEHRDYAESQFTKALILEAGAGTGKTRTMVGRIVRALEGGTNIHEVVAITFTVKAAYELRQRLRVGLGDLKTPAAMDALAGLGSARIGTIDALIQEILTEYPVETGVPAGFRIVSSSQLTDLFEVWFTTSYHTWTVDLALEEAWAALSEIELRPIQIQGIMRSVCRAALRSAENTGLPAPAGSVQDVLHNWLRDYLAPAEALIAGTGNLEERAWEYAGCLRVAASVLAGDPFAEFEPPPSLRTLGGTSGGQCREALKTAWALLSECAAPSLRYSVVRPLLAKAAADVRQFTAGLSNAGMLDFDRALHHVVRMLETRSDVRDRIAGELRGVLIDEFQDTSPSQIRFAELLAGEGAVPLFVVGDPKQSIYRFRGADLTAYVDFKAAGDRPRKIRYLDCNFRSQSGILALVDVVFEEAFAGSGITYRSLEASTAHEAKVDSNVALCGSEIDPPHVAVREAELAVLAISTAMHEMWRVCDSDGPRRIRLRDMVILYRAHKTAAVLGAALGAARIPYRIETQTPALGTNEIRSVRNVLRHLTRKVEDSEAARKIARVAALRSLACGLCDSDLRDNAAVMAADAGLKTLGAQIEDLCPSRAVETVIAACGLTPLAAAAVRPRATLNRLRMLVDKAMAFESAGPVTTRAFVDALDAEAGEPCDESPAPETDEDAVRLMTVHAAKGLEFPMVIVLGFASKPMNPPSILNGKHGDLLVSLGSKENGTLVRPHGFQEASQADKDESRRELSRMLYVAMTRARDHLVVSLWRAKQSNDLMKSIAGLEEAGKLGRWRREFHAVAPPISPSEPFEYPDTAELLARWSSIETKQPRTTPTRLAQDHRNRASTQPVTVAAPGADAGLDVDEVGPEPESDTDPTTAVAPPISLAASSSTALGHSVHVALQTVSLTEPDPGAASRNAAAEFQADPGRVEVLVRRALGAGIVQEAFASRKIIREVYAGVLGSAGAESSLVPPGKLLEGVVDLVWERADSTLAVIDYKTNRISSRQDALELMDTTYTVQGLAYKELLEAAAGQPVTAVYFLFLALDPPVVIDALAEPQDSHRT